MKAEGTAPTQADIGRAVYADDDESVTTAAAASEDIPRHSHVHRGWALLRKDASRVATAETPRKDQENGNAPLQETNRQSGEARVVTDQLLHQVQHGTRCGRRPRSSAGDGNPSDTAVEEHDWLGTVPGLSEWKDERKAQNLRAENIQIVNKDFESTIRINKNDIADDKLGLINPKIGRLGEKAGLHYGDLLVQALVAGFSASSAFGTAYDGKAYFAADHQDGEGPVQSNTGSNVALSETAYFAARAQMWSLQDEYEHPWVSFPIRSSSVRRTRRPRSRSRRPAWSATVLAPA